MATYAAFWGHFTEELWIQITFHELCENINIFQIFWQLIYVLFSKLQLFFLYVVNFPLLYICFFFARLCMLLFAFHFAAVTTEFSHRGTIRDIPILLYKAQFTIIKLQMSVSNCWEEKSCWGVEFCLFIKATNLNIKASWYKPSELTNQVIVKQQQQPNLEQQQRRGDFQNHVSCLQVLRSIYRQKAWNTWCNITLRGMVWNLARYLQKTYSTDIMQNFTKYK